MAYVSSERRSRYDYSPSSRYRSRSRSNSRSRSRSPESDETSLNPGNNLYITGLSSRVTEKDLIDHCSTEGKVVECHLVVDPRTKESRGFGFVTMESLEGADRCIKHLNKSILEGRVITVEKARRKRARTPTPGKYLGVRTTRGSSSYDYERRRSPNYSPYRSSRDYSPDYSPYRSRSRSRYRGRSRSPQYSPYRYGGHYRDRSPSPYRYRRTRDRDRSPSSDYSPRREDRGRSPSPLYSSYRGRRRYHSPSRSPTPTYSYRSGRRYRSPSRTPVRRYISRSRSRSVSPYYR